MPKKSAKSCQWHPVIIVQRANPCRKQVYELVYFGRISHVFLPLNGVIFLIQDTLLSFSRQKKALGAGKINSIIEPIDSYGGERMSI